MPFSLSLEKVISAVDGRLINKNLIVNDATEIIGVQTDSRQLMSKELFVPLVGGNHDAHDFIDSAIENGARFILTHKDLEELPGVYLVKVKDTLEALQKLANYWRQLCDYKVIAISGSNGKTTSKEYARSIIQELFPVTASYGSFNNHWGVPLTILNSNKDDQVLILEMGMNHLGELKKLSQIAEQDVSVITTIGRAHIGEVGSFDNIINAKKELYDFSPNALHIFNFDNPHTLNIAKNSSVKKSMSFSKSQANCDVYLEVVSSSINGLQVQGKVAGVAGSASVPVIGDHNVYNLMVASCLALSVGVTPEQIWSLMPKVKGAWGRCDLLRTKKGIQVLFDAYNANPESVKALHENIQGFTFPGKKVFILGDMLELGIESEKSHEEIFVELQGVYDHVWYIGSHRELAEKYFCLDKNINFITASYDEQIASNLYEQINENDTVVIKGSRGLELERIVQCWGLNYIKS